MPETKLERNIPVPRQRSRWPFVSMKVGDSFTTSIAGAPSMRSTAAVRGKKLGRHFIVRREGENYRCWRDK